MNGILGFFGLATLDSKHLLASNLADARARASNDKETIETLRTKLRDTDQEYADYRAGAEDRFHAIAALETPSANATARKMARLARGSDCQ